MGELKVNNPLNDKERLVYTHHLLDDLKSLEYMLDSNMIESGIIRLGAEQEFCLVNDYWRPASKAKEVIDDINDKHFTSELAKYNIEINLDPFEVEYTVFQKLKAQLVSLLDKAHRSSAKLNSKVLLSGILPSITLDELDIDFMTQQPRYLALNEMLIKNRGTDFRMQLTGVDELAIAHNNIMFEACNTSFQMHLQIDPDDFESSYNWAQAIAGPVLAIAVNSPLLLGKELWHETRIALFQQSIDIRKLSRAHIDQQARVSFGEDWVRGTIVDHFKNEISRFPILLTKAIEKNSYQELLNKNTPQLNALNLHNGTVYRWNRPCYGVGGGKAHIRIENRYIPSGPTVDDEIANMAFWVGLMSGRTQDSNRIWEKMEFEEAKLNFNRAATQGADAIMSWMGKSLSVKELINNELLPQSRKGLTKLNIDPKDIDYFLSIIKNRLGSNTGSQWIVRNYRNIKKKKTIDQASLTITKAIYNNQWSGKVVGDWLDTEEELHQENYASKVGHIMTTSTITSHPYDSARLTVEYMKWNNIHHLPVLDRHNNLVGLVTWSLLNRYWDQVHDSNQLIYVKDIMIKEVITVKTSTSIVESISLAKKFGIGCLPVVQNDRLVGIITHRDLTRIKNANI